MVAKRGWKLFMLLLLVGCFSSLHCGKEIPQGTEATELSDAGSRIEKLAGDEPQGLEKSPEAISQDVVVEREALQESQVSDSNVPEEAAKNGVKTLLSSENQTALNYRSYGIVIDSQSNLFITDTLNHKILKISLDGKVSTFAGSTQGYKDGQGRAAQFHEPHGLAIDKNDNLYITDTNNHRIRKIDPQGKVTTLAGNGSAGVNDGVGVAAQFNEPQGITVDDKANVYVADTVNHRVRKMDNNGTVTTIAGSTRGYKDGQGRAAQFNFIFGIVINDKNELYVADSYNHRIRKITSSGEVTTIAGSGSVGESDGQGTQATFNQPHGITLDQNGNLYIADMQNHRIRMLAPNGQVTTLAGSKLGLQDGEGQAAQFNKPYALTFANNGNLYIADTYNYRLRVLKLSK